MTVRCLAATMILISTTQTVAQEAPAARPAGPTDLHGLVLGLAPLSTTPEKELAGLPKQVPAAVLTWKHVYTRASARVAIADPAAHFAELRDVFRAASGSPFKDPGPAYLEILRRVRAIDDDSRFLAWEEKLLGFVKELIQGESGGLDQGDIDFVVEAVGRDRRRIAAEVERLRDDLDRLKVDLGWRPDAAVVPDRGPLSAFGAVFAEVGLWSARPDHHLAALDRIVGRLPEIGDLIVEGRPVLDPIEREPNTMEDALRDLSRRAIADEGKDQPARPPGPRDPALELRVRQGARKLLRLRGDYAEARRSYILRVRLLDMAFERAFRASIPGPASLRSPAIPNLVAARARVAEAERLLVAIWTEFRADRLRLSRDLGSLPFDTWDAFEAGLTAR